MSSWPISITNLGAASLATLNVLFTTDFTLNTANHYFIALSSYIQFGSNSLKLDGTQVKFTISNVTDYPGLIRNGTSGANGNRAVSVKNIGVEASGSTTLLDDGGWICQSYFGRGVACSVLACYSTGEIPGGAGGIVGAFSGSSSGTLTIEGCYSSGDIVGVGGGITGRNCADGGTLRVNLCSSKGALYGFYGGGICGRYAGKNGSATCSSCYSIGRISGNNAGGIFGANAGDNGFAKVVHSYSRGNIEGSNAGGICGQNFGVSSTVCIIEKCYSTGTIGSTEGGIRSSSTAAVIAILSCYTSGFLAGANGAIIAGSTTIPSGSYAEGDGSWKDVNAVATITRSGWIQQIVNTPFFIDYFSYSPYSLDNITDASGNPFKLDESASIQVGESTSAALAPGYTFYLLTTDTDIFIDSSTGVISTASTISPGTYNLIIFANNVSSYYATVTYTLTIAAPPAPAQPADGNQQINNFANISSEMRYNLLSGQYMSTNASYVNVRQFGSYADYLKYRLANGF